MKIVILGAYTLPTGMPLDKLLSKADPIYHVSFRPHPWVELGECFAKWGHEVHILTMMGDVKGDRYIQFRGVHYHIIKSTSIPFKAITCFKSNVWKMHRIIDAIVPDIINVQSRGRQALFGLTTAYPCIVTNHGNIDEHYAALLEGKENLDYYRFKFQERKANRRMRYCIGVSPNCTNDCLQYLPKEKVYLIDNLVESIYLTKVPLYDSNSILYAGSISQRKQTLELVKAIEKVENAQLRIASFAPDTQYEYKIREYISRNNLSNRIKFIGFKKQPELIKVISNSLAVCLPSTYESFGRTLAESMAMGKPVIASNIEAHRYVVKDGVTGLLFEPGNIEQLAEKIRFLINNKDIAREMGEKGREEALQRWDPDVIAEKTMAVYEKVIVGWDQRSRE